MPKRSLDAMRPLVIRPHYLAHPEGSALIAFGDTQVICTVSAEERVPPWLVGRGRGWVTAEYDMLPRATHSRNARDSHKGKINGRTQEIGRLIARSLRRAIDLSLLGERTLTVDCDVIQADGGTRTAAITGGSVALAIAVETLRARGKLKVSPFLGHVSAVSVGMIDGQAQLDLDYALDSRAEVDLNVVMTWDDKLAEVQGTGETSSFSRSDLAKMVDLAFTAREPLARAQRDAAATPYHAKLGAV